MKDNNEQLSAAKAEWLQTLDYDCRVNTINYWALRDQLRFGRLEGLAAKLYGFIKVRGWQKLGVFSSDGLKRTVASFSSFVDWCGADFSDGGLKPRNSSASSPTRLSSSSPLMPPKHWCKSSTP